MANLLGETEDSTLLTLPPVVIYALYRLTQNPGFRENRIFTQLYFSWNFCQCLPKRKTNRISWTCLPKRKTNRISYMYSHELLALRYIQNYTGVHRPYRTGKVVLNWSVWGQARSHGDAFGGSSPQFFVFPYAQKRFKHNKNKNLPPGSDPSICK